MFIQLIYSSIFRFDFIYFRIPTKSMYGGIIFKLKSRAKDNKWNCSVLLTHMLACAKCVNICIYLYNTNIIPRDWYLFIYTYMRGTPPLQCEWTRSSKREDAHLCNNLFVYLLYFLSCRVVVLNEMRCFHKWWDSHIFLFVTNKMSRYNNFWYMYVNVYARYW